MVMHNTSDVKRKSLEKYGNSSEVSKKWVSIYKKFNENCDSNQLRQLIIEATALLEFVMENILGDKFKGGRFNDNLELIADGPYDVNYQDVYFLKKIKWYRNMSAHQTETVMEEIIDFRMALTSFKSIGELLYKLGVLPKESIVPDHVLLRANTGDVIGGSCLLNELLGEGASGRVFKGYHNRLDLEVAVKEINHDIGEILDYKNEKNMLLKLRHDGIPRIYDVIEDNHTYYIVMDLIQGKTLDEYVGDLGKMTDSATIRIAIQLCSILSYLHNYSDGIIYKDLKPSNIIVDNKQQVHLIDFGISVMASEQDSKTSMYSGTKMYSSPEQLRGEAVDQRTDIYSLGGIIYFLYEGILPDRKGDRRYSNNADPFFIDIIEKAMSYERNKRYNEVDEIIEDLNERFSIDKSASSQSESEEKISIKTFKLNKTWNMKLVITSLIVIIVIAFGIISNNLNKETDLVKEDIPLVENFTDDDLEIKDESK